MTNCAAARLCSRELPQNWSLSVNELMKCWMKVVRSQSSEGRSFRSSEISRILYASGEKKGIEGHKKYAPRLCQELVDAISRERETLKCKSSHLRDYQDARASSSRKHSRKQVCCIRARLVIKVLISAQKRADVSRYKNLEGIAGQERMVLARFPDIIGIGKRKAGSEKVTFYFGWLRCLFRRSGEQMLIRNVVSFLQ